MKHARIIALIIAAALCASCGTIAPGSPDPLETPGEPENSPLRQQQINLYRITGNPTHLPW